MRYASASQQVRKPSAKGGVAELSSSGPQRRQGAVTIADGEVDIRYGDQRLRADHVEYNDQTNEAIARGHVQFDYESQHLEGDEAHYNVGTGRGTFLNVRGTVKIEAARKSRRCWSPTTRSILKPSWWRDLATICTSFTRPG